MTTDDLEMLRLWRRARGAGFAPGGLPDPGGAFDQAAAMMDAFALMDRADEELKDDRPDA